MVVLIPSDFDRTIDFYRRIGVDIPAAARPPRVEVKMTGGLSFLVLGQGRVPELDDTRLLFEFYLKARSALQSNDEELAGLGVETHHAPFLTSFGMRDPDGNTVSPVRRRVKSFERKSLWNPL